MNVRLGFEVGSGAVVDIPVAHTCVAGITQLAGKTTTLEALITRSGLKAVTFVTKRGEGAFTTARRTPPYFREAADWQFVASILEASRGEKMRFERAWIIRASRGAKTLADVQRNVKKAMETAKGMSADVYLTLDAYLDAVVPTIQRVAWAPALTLQAGVNAVDLSGVPVEMQHLVIRSCLEWVLERERDTVVVVPEAWKFCLSDDTEVLTPAGWKLGVEVRPGEMVACFDTDTEECTFQPTRDVIVQPYEGPMVHLRGKTIDCLCTPDHRVVLSGFDHETGSRLSSWRFVQASSLPRQFIVPTPRPIAGPGVPELSARMLRILGWVITDGWQTRSQSLSIEQALSTKKRGVSIAETMRDVLVPEGASVYERSRGGKIQIDKRYAACPRSDTLTFYFGVEFSRRVKIWLGEQVHRIPRQLLEMCSVQQLRELYEGLMEGDGTSLRGKWLTFYAGLNEPLADDFQELCSRLGIRSIKALNAGQWRVAVSDVRDRWVRRGPLVAYSGAVWDLTVPTGAFVARRNGKVFVTGNCPEGRTTPVKFAASAFIRQGAALGNYLWIDSQDLGGVSKEILRSVSVWILGVQREANEIKRTLSNIPAGVSKPKPEALATLGIGEFFACWGRHAVRTYVQPTWLIDDLAQNVAMGNLSAASMRAACEPELVIEEVGVTNEEAEALRRENQDLKTQVKSLTDRLAIQEKVRAVDDAITRIPRQRAPLPSPSPSGGIRHGSSLAPSGDVEALYQVIKARLMADAAGDPVLLKVMEVIPELQVQRRREVITASADELPGRVALLLVEGWFEAAKKATTTTTEMGKRGWTHDYRNVAKALDQLTTKGFFRKDADGYTAVRGMQAQIFET